MKNPLFIKFTIFLMVFGWSMPIVTRSQSPDKPPAASQADEIAKLRAENQKLQVDLKTLREENQMLRKLLVQGESKASPARNAPAKPLALTAIPAPVPATSTTPAPAPSPPAASASPTLTHWLTTSSGTRHNSSCRYYQTSTGRLCTATEGTPCKKCGG